MPGDLSQASPAPHVLELKSAWLVRQSSRLTDPDSCVSRYPLRAAHNLNPVPSFLMLFRYFTFLDGTDEPYGEGR